MAIKWYGLFSHTGKELEELSKESQTFGVQLQGVFTDNSEYQNTVFDKHIPVYKCDSRIRINHLLQQPGIVEDNSIITLNGYMGIIPADVLRNLKSRGCKIYNIHPAPIQLYPELRGKDPQERLYEGIQRGLYDYVGVVIHEVDEGIDTGAIVYWLVKFADASMSKELFYKYLHSLGTQAWMSFFEERFYEDGKNS